MQALLDQYCLIGQFGDEGEPCYRGVLHHTPRSETASVKNSSDKEHDTHGGVLQKLSVVRSVQHDATAVGPPENAQQLAPL
jgi:hypothetical protein